MLRFALLPTLALTLVLAACGGGDDDDDTGAPAGGDTPAAGATATTPSGAGSSEPEPLRVPLEAGSSGETEGQDIGTVRVTILEVIDPANDVSPLPPDPGMRLWAVRVRVEALGGGTGNTGEWTLTTTSGDQYTWTGTASGEDLGYREFPAGESREGIMAFSIPEKAEVQSVLVNVSIYVTQDILFEA